uniref:Uncharacterized protein n=1 Tax=Acrobeloides nanus TaxID=290746 RepID=A0A914CT24_9BILA
MVNATTDTLNPNDINDTAIYHLSGIIDKLNPNNSTKGGDGFADDGNSFIASSSGSPKNSITFDLRSLCEASATKFYYGAYRSPKLFVTSLDQSFSTGSTGASTQSTKALTSQSTQSLSTSTAHGKVFGAIVLDSSSSDSSTSQEMIPSSDTQPPEQGPRCGMGNFFSGGSIMGGDIVSGLNSIGQNVQISYGLQSKAIKATLKYSKSHYTKPLHGKFEVNSFSPQTGFANSNPCSVNEDGENFVSDCTSSDTHFTLLNNGLLTDPRLCSDVFNKLVPILSGYSMLTMVMIIIAYLSKYDKAPEFIKKLSAMWEKADSNKKASQDKTNSGTTTNTVVNPNENAPQTITNSGTITNKVANSNEKASQAVGTILDKVVDSNENTRQAIINLGIILDKVADPNEDAHQAITNLGTILNKVADSNEKASQAITNLGTILNKVPDPNENISQAKKNSGAIWDKLTKLTTLWYHLADPKLMQNDRLINGAYNATLLAFYICYTVFGDRRRLGGSMTACSVMAGVNYWLILSSIFMTMVESFCCVKKFYWKDGTFKKWLEFISTGFPAVGLAYALSTIIMIPITIFIRKVYSRDDDFCWIRPDYIAVIVIPMGILCASGFICYGLILLQKTATQFPGQLCLKLIFGFDDDDLKAAEEHNSKPAKEPNSDSKNKNTSASSNEPNSDSAKKDNSAPPNKPNSDSAKKDNSAPSNEPNSDSNKFSSSISRLGFIHIALAFPFLFEYLATNTSEVNIFHYLFTIILGGQGIILTAHGAVTNEKFGGSNKGDEDIEANGGSSGSNDGPPSSQNTNGNNLVEKIFDEVDKVKHVAQNKIPKDLKTIEEQIVKKVPNEVDQQVHKLTDEFPNPIQDFAREGRNILKPGKDLKENIVAGIDAGKKNLENIEAGIMSEGNHLSVDNVKDIPQLDNGLVKMVQNGENFLKIWENLVEDEVDKVKHVAQEKIPKDLKTIEEQIFSEGQNEVDQHFKDSPLDEVPNQISNIENEGQNEVDEHFKDSPLDEVPNQISNIENEGQNEVDEHFKDSPLDEVPNQISNIENEGQNEVDAGKENLENVEAGIMSEGNNLSVDQVEDIPELDKDEMAPIENSARENSNKGEENLEKVEGEPEEKEEQLEATKKPEEWPNPRSALNLNLENSDTSSIFLKFNEEVNYDVQDIENILKDLYGFIQSRGNEQEKEQAKEIFAKLESFYHGKRLEKEIFDKLKDLYHDSTFAEELKRNRIMSSYIVILLDTMRNAIYYTVKSPLYDTHLGGN